ncbi:storkhead-box protein 2 isoform X3 [Hemibagrus wyckioides]|nr:storkhead-box protein 2 isoform X3 [Hemibagrus wyckioides]XP_058263642.1 storkhead-box protein 2 isoform X3 [Hemibagrus wyckioides]XP_058263643.1 storkhead-box protein 2 isoform X3 [Hemibagrus wyckioides]
MSPISQSQFIPLGDILCLAISAMNSARKTVTQETLIEHLATCFPGVPTPSLEVLRHTLNMLVRERKIYPTPEGYFIVTPQTYFITPSLIHTNSKWYHLDERIPGGMQPCSSPPSSTMTPSASGCVRERSHHKNHADPYSDGYREDMPNTHNSTLQRRSKEHKEPPHPVSPPPHQSSEKNKSALSFAFKTEGSNSRQKDGSSSGGGSEKQSKKFGLKLFRLSFKKDKSKHLATFSAQFPPEEWPLRDEETPTTVPRDVEMEIIRRINPDLTVENLARHTAVMKRLEEEKAQRSKANSSAQQSTRSKRSRSHRKAQQGKSSRSHSKTRASRGERSEGSNLDISYDRDYRFYSSSLVRSPRETMMSMERNRGKYMVHSNPNIVESHFTTAPEWDVSGELAKRRTEMPFPEPSRAQSHSKVHRSHSHTQERKSRNERSDKAKERSRSMDNSKGPLGGPFLGTVDDFECSPDDRNRYYTDDGTLRASAQKSHYSRAMHSAARLNSDICVPDVGRGGPEDAMHCRTLEKSKSKDCLTAFTELKACSLKTSVDDYFQHTAVSEASYSAPSSLVKSSHEFTDGVWKGIPSERTAPILTSPRPVEYNDDSTMGQNSITLSVSNQMPEPLPNGRLMHQHNPDSGDLDKMAEVYNQETLFKPVDYVESSFSRPGTMRKSPHSKSMEVLENQEHFEDPLPLSVPTSSAQEQASCMETTFDYYNVSDDDSEDTSHKNKVEEKVLEGGGTMKWLLEREKERDLQRKFEKNLTFLSPKEGESSNSQKSAHSTRLDSMDSSSVTVDSGFNSPRTRESLASNTSSNVDNNRRQNMVLSPRHMGTKRPPPPYHVPSFRPVPEPPATRPEKQASITSV